MTGLSPKYQNPTIVAQPPVEGWAQGATEETPHAGGGAERATTTSRTKSRCTRPPAPTFRSGHRAGARSGAGVGRPLRRPLQQIQAAWTLV